MSSSEKAQQMQQQGMINRVGCIAIFLIVLFIIIIAVVAVNVGLQSKYKLVEAEFNTLKEKLTNGLDTPRALGRYIEDENMDSFDSVMARIESLRPAIEAADTLPDLDAVFRDYKDLSMKVRELVSPHTLEVTQGARNQEAQVDGIYNRYQTQRDILVPVSEKFNASLSNFPNNIIGGMFGLRAVPLDPPEVKE